MTEGQSPFEHGRYRYARIDGRGRTGDHESPENASRPGGRGSRLFDRLIGIVLGLVLGIAIIVAFLFLGSEDTIDAPRIDDPAPAREAPARPGGTGAGERTP